MERRDAHQAKGAREDMEGCGSRFKAQGTGSNRLGWVIPEGQLKSRDFPRYYFNQLNYNLQAEVAAVIYPASEEAKRKASRIRNG